MVGDTKWDIEAAAKAGVPTLCVMTGGWSRQELLDAGAVQVYESVDELRREARRVAARPLGRLFSSGRRLRLSSWSWRRTRIPTTAGMSGSQRLKKR